MKVLEIMGSLHRGGAETMIMNYYRAFDRKLCQMDFVIHGRFENDYYDEALSLGANIIETCSPGKIGIFKYIKNLKDIIKNYGPYDAIHIHTDYQAFLSVIAGKAMHINNIVVHSHSTNFTTTIKLLNRAVFCMANVQRIACGKAAGEAFFGKNNFIILNNAIDIRRILNVKYSECKENRRRLFGNAYVIGHLGRFSKAKNHKFIIELAHELAKEKQNIVFACYGEGEEENEIKEMAKERKLSNIYFMGITADVMTVYPMFDIFILPSLFEGFPVTLIESQLSNVYSITSNYVSKECDLGMNMLKFLPLEIELWKNEILNNITASHNKCNNLKVFSEYDVNIQWKKLYQIYRHEL